MSNKIHKKTRGNERKLDRKNIQPRSGKLRKSPVIVNINQESEYEQIERKIEVEIREVIRIAPHNFAALKNSFESWASQWD